MLGFRTFKRLTLAAAAGAVIATTAGFDRPAAAPVEVTVYKTPTCGCCQKWVSHLEANGFKVKTVDLEDLAEVKGLQGVPDDLQSCHTAVVGKYVVEGHVPAADIHRLLKQQPKVLGLAVPGMPMGSPGMEGPRKDKYDVLTFDRGGRTAVFASH
ncbi:MAG TPA: DUF411 domain-containing protein [Gemmatimonadales bacterium]|nr:DUF411 domain-containing protein [Gemmatimonadales bacterium]